MTKQEYDRKRYLEKKKERFGKRKCPICEIYLSSKYGSHYTRTYCRDCSGSKAAIRHKNKKDYIKHRTKRLAYQKQYDANKKMLEL